MKIGLDTYTKPQIKLIPEDRRFIELINNKITIYGQIPYTVPEKLIIDLTKECALYFFRMGYWRSQHVCFYQLRKSDVIEFLCNEYQHPEDEEICAAFDDCLNSCDYEYGTGNKHKSHHIHPEKINPNYAKLRGYAIKLPSYVNAVREIFECNKTELSTEEVFDSSVNIMFNQQMSPYGYSLMGINSNLYMYEVSVKLTEQAAYQAVLGTSVPFRYNNANHTLIINMEIKEETKSLMLQCDCNVDIQNLYVDDLFIKYVENRCKQELRRLIGSHTIQLPGDVTLNVDELCYNCDTNVEKVEEQLKGSTGIGDIILQR